MSKIRRALGLMSGTSLDGIDVALVETDGAALVRRIAARSVAYPEDFRARLRQALVDARAVTRRDERLGILGTVEAELTERHGEVALRLMGDLALQPSALDVIGFHGQTVLHRPETGLTLQLGDGARLSAMTGVDVIFDMRAADVAAGGQGAPLVPAYHRALASRLPQSPVALVNVGGVANITFVSRDGSLVAFDTGPGNALIDDLVKAATGAPFDADGAIAARGTPDARVVHEFMMHPYFAKPVPKSLDRNSFPPELIHGLSFEDAVATLTAFTAEAIVRAREHLPEEPALWIITGGGRRNKKLMSAIAARVENAVVPAEAVGLDGDGMEAEAWAYLAVRSLDGLPLTFPGTTGVGRPTTGGVLAKAGQA